MKKYLVFLAIVTLTFLSIATHAADLPSVTHDHLPIAASVEYFAEDDRYNLLFTDTETKQELRVELEHEQPLKIVFGPQKRLINKDRQALNFSGLQGLTVFFLANDAATGTNRIFMILIQPRNFKTQYKVLANARTYTSAITDPEIHIEDFIHEKTRSHQILALQREADEAELIKVSLNTLKFSGENQVASLAKHQKIMDITPEVFKIESETKRHILTGKGEDEITGDDVLFEINLATKDYTKKTIF